MRRDFSRFYFEEIDQPQLANRHAEPDPAQAEPERPRKITATSFKWRDPARIPRRAFIYARHYVRRNTVCTIGAGALGKSSLLLVEAVAIALKEPLLGIMPNERTNVWYWNGEDPQDETERRIAAICQHFNIDARRLEGQLFIDSGRANPIKLAQLSNGKIVLDAELIADICQTINQNEIGIATFDPLISCHRIPENDNTNIDEVVKEFAQMADATNSCIAFAHHVRKGSPGTTSEMTADDSRGGTAIINGVRAARVLNRMTEAQGGKYRVFDRRSYFRLDDGKTNLAPSETAKWFHFADVNLPNGDSVGVVEAWTPASALEDITTDHMQRVRVMAGSGDWRKDPRSPEWIGRAVADVTGLNIDGQEDKKKIKAILEDWFKNLVLATELREDKVQRKKFEFVIPGKWEGGLAQV